MKIVILDHDTFLKNQIIDALEDKGHEVMDINTKENKILMDEYDNLTDEEYETLINAKFFNIVKGVEQADAVLAFNNENQLSGDASLAFLKAFVLEKDIYLFNDAEPKLKNEMDYFKPVYLNKDLEKIGRVSKIQNMILNTISFSKKDIKEISATLNIAPDICSREVFRLIDRQFLTNDSKSQYYVMKKGYEFLRERHPRLVKKY